MKDSPDLAKDFRISLVKKRVTKEPTVHRLYRQRRLFTLTLYRIDSSGVKRRHTFEQKKADLN